MQASHVSKTPASIQNFYNQPMQHFDPYGFQAYQDFNNDSSRKRSQGTEFSFEAQAENFFTLESTPANDFAIYNSSSVVSNTSNRSPLSLFTLESTPANDFAIYNSSSVVSNTSNRSPLSQNSHSYASDLHHSSANIYGSPMRGSIELNDEEKLMIMELLGPQTYFEDSGFFYGIATQPSPFTKYDRILETAQHMDLKQLLVTCAEILSDADTFPLTEGKVAISAAESLMGVLEKRVSVSGDPLQRLGAYMLEGLRARLVSSGSIIYKKLKCKEPTTLPTSSELMSYMGMLYQMCPYYKFAYTSSNAIIKEAMENESHIHIIDFQIAQGSQWISLIQDLSRRPGGPLFIRITGVDDSDSVHARGGGLEIVGQKLAQVAQSCGVTFEFHGAAMSGCEVHLENLNIQHGEALAVNFPYILHHMPDESVSTANHRDRLLRLVKSLSPKVVTVVEQESNTNTGTFFQRFCETLDYYTAMFESIDAKWERGDRLRISAEEHCVAKDVVNIIACEGIERVERHELFGKWRSRLMMAGFSPVQLSPSASNVVRDVLKDYSTNFRLVEGNGALYLGWRNRTMATSSAWR